MNYSIRKSSDRGFYDHGWLKTIHTFSFGGYYDPEFMGFGTLRVINEDRVAPNKGFGAHDHQNMEIITYVLEGQLAHRDSTGTESILGANELQLMHAGSGITHSEYNPSSKDAVHFLQIWIKPDIQDAKPGYQQMLPVLMKNQLTLVASKDGQQGSLQMHQNAKLYIADMDLGSSFTIQIGQFGWLQVASGSFLFGDVVIDHGDGIAIESPGELTLTAKTAGKVLFFELH